MSIENEPSLNDIFTMIRTKAATISNITDVLGSSPLRLYRSFPPGKATYPVGIMSRIATEAIPEHRLQVNYFVRLTFWIKSEAKANLDTLIQEFTNLFSNASNTYNQGNTKIERVDIVSGGNDLYDDKERAHGSSMTLAIKARRKNV